MLRLGNIARSAMVTTEQQLLALLESCGFDFTATARDIATRFPQELDWGVPSSVALPVQLTQPFAGFGPIWKMPGGRSADGATREVFGRRIARDGVSLPRCDDVPLGHASHS